MRLIGISKYHIEYCHLVVMTGDSSFRTCLVYLLTNKVRKLLECSLYVFTKPIQTRFRFNKLVEWKIEKNSRTDTGSAIEWCVCSWVTLSLNTKLLFPFGVLPYSERTVLLHFPIKHQSELVTEKRRNTRRSNRICLRMYFLNLDALF